MKFRTRQLTPTARLLSSQALLYETAPSKTISQ